jgi:RNA polymerase sigma factor (sigma-70 family)
VITLGDDDAMTAARAIRVMIVDDHSLVRTGLAHLLTAAGEFDLVATAKNGEEAIELVDLHAPDVVLMDLSMPVLDGIAATKRILASHPETRVLVLSTFSDRRMVLEAIDAGAVGYVLKDGEPDELIRAARAVARGESPLDPRVAQAVLSARSDRVAPELRGREREVIQLVVDRLSNREIGERLGITEKTVKTHLTRIYQRLGIRNRQEAMTWAARNGVRPTAATDD